jgi:mono/diheme cytochrome c family protein
MFKNSASNFNNTKLLFIALLVLSVLLIASCSGGGDGEFTVIKGTEIGPFNAAQAAIGKKIFSEKCASCHKYDVKLVGPPLGTVVKNRSVDYILSQILHPDKMIANNDTTKALLAKYLTQMPNQHLNMIEAKAVFMHLMDVSNGGGK